MNGKETMKKFHNKKCPFHNIQVGRMQAVSDIDQESGYKEQ